MAATTRRRPTRGDAAERGDAWGTAGAARRGPPTPGLPGRGAAGWLADFVAAEAEATQTPADLAGMLALAALAPAVGGLVQAEAKPGWCEPLNPVRGRRDGAGLAQVGRVPGRDRAA